MAEKSWEQRLLRRAESRIMEADSTKGRLPDGEPPFLLADVCRDTETGCLLILLGGAGKEAVSYTHLDVYKRQPGTCRVEGSRHFRPRTMQAPAFPQKKKSPEPVAVGG